MKTLQEQIEAEEGRWLWAYPDSLGWWTIGVGHYLGVALDELEAKALRAAMQTDPDTYGKALYNTLEHLPSRRWPPMIRLNDHEADALLTADIGVAEVGARRVVGVFDQLDEPRQAALTSMAFQMGEARLRRFARMVGALDRLDYEKAAGEALDSRWAKQTPERAGRIAEQLRTGEVV